MWRSSAWLWKSNRFNLFSKWKDLENFPLVIFVLFTLIFNDKIWRGKKLIGKVKHKKESSKLLINEALQRPSIVNALSSRPFINIHKEKIFFLDMLTFHHVFLQLLELLHLFTSMMWKLVESSKELLKLLKLQIFGICWLSLCFLTLNEGLPCLYFCEAKAGRKLWRAFKAS